MSFCHIWELLKFRVSLCLKVQGCGVNIVNLSKFPAKAVNSVSISSAHCKTNSPQSYDDFKEKALILAY